MEIAILIWVVCGIGAALVASNRGGNGCLWFGLGVLLGPIGLACSFAGGSDRQCPYCKSPIHQSAVKCPKCQGAFEELWRCPACKTPLIRGVEKCPSCSGKISWKDVPGGGTKKCPDCAEEIKADARKCRFCGRLFDQPDSIQTQQCSNCGVALTREQKYCNNCGAPSVLYRN